ncbi:MAG TPA: hypothetical protein VE958_04360 [Bryobacteraceae bacterium]|nr:hypothetical protein [Bryobacteraceae bacterium]
MRVIGIKRMHGVGKATGNKYDFAELFVMVGIDQVSGEKFSIEGYGSEVASMECDPSVVSQFSGIDYPAELDLKTDQKLVRGEFKTVCVGLNRPAELKVA